MNEDMLQRSLMQRKCSETYQDKKWKVKSNRIVENRFYCELLRTTFVRIYIFN